jgi:hypothetical protein
MIDIVGILLAAGDSEHSCAQNIDHTMRHQQRIRWICINTASRHAIPIGSRQKHYSAIGRSSEFPAFDG